MAKKKKKSVKKRAKPQVVLHTRTRVHPTQALGSGPYGTFRPPSHSNRQPISR